MAVGVKTWAAATLALGILAGVFAWAVPPGSWPVGWDVWLNLHVSQSWRETGFPERLPEAGFTLLARAFADWQLLLHALLVMVPGADLARAVPPLVWLSAVAQGGVLLLCIRSLCGRVNPWWAVLLPALSSTWTFRLTELRGISLATLTLLPLFTCAVRRARGDAVRPVWIGALAAAFTYAHGAVLLPLILVAGAALGARLQGRPLRAADLGWTLAGITLAACLRPDFPQILTFMAIVNVGLPLGVLRGELAPPGELTPYALDDLLAWNSPFLLALAAVIWLLCAGLRRPGTARAPLAVALPVLVLCLFALGSRRFFETATPLLVLLAAVLHGGRLPWHWLLLALLVLPWQAREAARNAAANRHPLLREVADWLRAEAAPGDVVFVTDWGLSAALMYHARGKGLVFTGCSDPSLMWWEDPAAFHEWMAIKQARAPHPVTRMRERFGARFLVMPANDSAPGRPAGETARHILRDLQALERPGRAIPWIRPGPWLACRLPD